MATNRRTRLDQHNNSYLRVLTPQTIDGVNLAYDEDKKPIFKETHLPLTAKKYLEIENENRPQQIKHTLEVVDVKKEVKLDKTPKVENDGGQDVNSTGTGVENFEL